MTRDTLETWSRFFGCCTILGFVLIYTWFAILMLPGNMVCSMSARFFDVTQHECLLINYSGIAFLKITVLVLFFFPWLAIRFEIWRRK